MRFALVANAVFLGVEVAGGFAFGSLALLADAAHMATDVVVLSILIYALLGKLADSASRLLERWTLAWHPAYQKS